METEIVVAILGSSVVAAFLTSWFGKISSDKSIRVKNVTEERKEWRDRLRVLVVMTTKAFQDKKISALKEVEAELIVRLNPIDKEDLEILECFKRLYSWNDTDLEELNDRISYLLKHDWERVKQECSTEIQSRSLALASFVATLLLILLACFVDVPHHLLMLILYVGVSVTAFFAMPAMLSLFEKMTYLKKKHMATFYYFCMNKIHRETYKDRASRLL